MRKGVSILHKRFMILSKNNNLDNIIYNYNLKDIKPHLKTSYTKNNYVKYLWGISDITHCIKFYTGGRFYNDQILQYEGEHEERIRNTMKVKYQVNLRILFMDFYKELCDKKMEKEDALFMERYIMKLLIFS